MFAIIMAYIAPPIMMLDASFNALSITFALIYWSAPWILAYNTTFDFKAYVGNAFESCFNAIGNLLKTILTGIDSFTETVFDVKFFSTEFASIIFDIEKQKETYQPRAQHAFFQDSPNKEHDGENEEKTGSVAKNFGYC